METKKMSFNVDIAIWKKLKTKAIEEGKTVTQILLRLITEYLNKK
jgi:macrodomain Ter protein organizer (MatP/YcbG family)